MNFVSDFSVKICVRLVLQIVYTNVDFRFLPNVFLSEVSSFYTFTSAQATCHNMLLYLLLLCYDNLNESNHTLKEEMPILCSLIFS